MSEEAAAEELAASTIKESDVQVSNEVNSGKNKRLVKCQFCPSHILQPLHGTYIQAEFELPMMAKKKNLPQNDGDVKEDTKYEPLTHFWEIKDMYTFENICFSNKVGDIKYLACADCEIGPIGYHNLKSKISYIALARVCHVD